ncbi:MAG: hypothetical protein ACLFS9_00850 [Nitriliruptoraceae bacterium]
MPNPFEEPIAGGGALPPAANPFRPGMGRIPPDFGGREDALLRARIVVEQLRAGVAPEFVLYRGVRGVGKTALLAYVRQRARELGLVTIHLEADRDDTELARATAVVLRGVSELLAGAEQAVATGLDVVRVGQDGPRLAGRADAHAFESLVGDLAELAGRTGRGTLLTVDEVHEAGDVLLGPLLRAAHRAAQDDRPLGVLLSGLPTAAENLFDEGQTYTERLGRVDLGVLDREGTAEAVRRPFDRVHGTAVDDAVVDAVHDGSGGYPWFVQLWGEALWDLADDPVRVALPVARAAGARVRVRVDDFYATRWRRVPSGRARLLVQALAEQGGEAAMGDLLEVVDMTHQAASPARRALLDLGICWAPARGRLAFSVPGFERWVLATQ